MFTYSLEWWQTEANPKSYHHVYVPFAKEKSILRPRDNLFADFIRQISFIPNNSQFFKYCLYIFSTISQPKTLNFRKISLNSNI